MTNTGTLQSGMFIYFLALIGGLTGTFIGHAHEAPVRGTMQLLQPIARQDTLPNWEHPLGGLIIIESFEGVLRPGTLEELLAQNERGEITIEIVRFEDLSRTSLDEINAMESSFHRGQILWIGRRVIYG